MKKIVLGCAAVLLSLGLLAGCHNVDDIIEPGPVVENPDSGDDGDGDGEPEHTHEYGEWQHDETYHWKECECGEIIDIEEHTLSYTANEDGETHTVYCEICGYEATKAHTLEYVSEDATGHYQVCTECEYTTSEVSHDLSYVSVDDTYHHQVCSECDYTTDSTEHDYEEVITIENLGADADAITATHDYECTVCGHTKTETGVSYTLAFEIDPWNVIDQVSSEGYASKYYAVGNTKNITINSESHDIRIIDFDHDTLTTSDSDYNGNKGTAGITCDMVDCLSTTHKMNSTATNEGGWDSSEIRSYLNSDSGCILSTLDSDLQSVIKKVDKVTLSSGNQTTSFTTSSDSLFLFSEKEVISTTFSSGLSGEGSTYAYWSNTTTSRKKYRSGSTSSWWLRSPSTNSEDMFYYVGTSGSAVGNSANYAHGVSFGFCI